MKCPLELKSEIRVRFFGSARYSWESIICTGFERGIIIIQLEWDREDILRLYNYYRGGVFYLKNTKERLK